MRLFRARGFEQTSVDEIAAASGISRRTFFRHFATKHAVVFAWQDLLAAEMAGQAVARPASEAPLTALRRAILSVIERYSQEDAVALADLVLRTPSLRAFDLAKRDELERIRQWTARDRVRPRHAATPDRQYRCGRDACRRRELGSSWSARHACGLRRAGLRSCGERLLNHV